MLFSGSPHLQLETRSYREGFSSSKGVITLLGLRREKKANETDDCSIDHMKTTRAITDRMMTDTMSYSHGSRSCTTLLVPLLLHVHTGPTFRQNNVIIL